MEQTTKKRHKLWLAAMILALVIGAIVWEGYQERGFRELGAKQPVTTKASGNAPSHLTIADGLTVQGGKVALPKESLNGGMIASGTIGSLQLAPSSITTKSLSQDVLTMIQTNSQSRGMPTPPQPPIEGPPVSSTVPTESGVGSGPIGTDGLKNDSITSDKIADGSITAEDIADGVITDHAIPDDSITSSKIADSSVTAEDIADDAVGSDKIADGSVEGNDIASGAIDSNKIGDGAISGSELAMDSVGSANIKDNSIAAADLESGAVTGMQVANNTITTADIANSTINSALIQDNSVSSSDLGSGSVTASDVASGAVTSGLIADDAVTARDIAPASITASELAADAVTSLSIVDGSITGADLAEGTITSTQLADGAVRIADLSGAARKRAVAVQIGDVTGNGKKEKPLFVAPTDGVITKITVTNGASYSAASAKGSLVVERKSDPMTIAGMINLAITSLGAFTPRSLTLTSDMAFAAGDVYSFKSDVTGAGSSLSSLLVTIEYDVMD